MEKVRLSNEKATTLATLYGRALDAASPSPILGDSMAREAVQNIDTDFTRTGLRRADAPWAAMRGVHLDGWTREFLAAYPLAVVLHLGCGLDTRVHRIDPGPGVDWYDVDFPEVIDLRNRLYPRRDGYMTIASSVTDAGWLDRVPADRPVLVVAEGLTMYLTEEDGRALFRRIVDRFPSGELIFDAASRRGLKLQRFNKVVKLSGSTLHWGIDSPAELEAIAPGLTCVTALSALELPSNARLGSGYRTLRVLAAIVRTVPVLRAMGVFYRLRF